jgi:oligosaccharide repeat unit polymerase
MLAGLTANIAATPVAFSMYLDTPEAEKRGMWGGYTFAPIYRLLSRLGFNTHVPAYEENYYTPVPVNISTYLKNVYSDFGLAGVFIFPFLLAFCSTALMLRPGSLTTRLILAHLYAVIAFSVLFNIMLLGYWYLSLATSIVIGKSASRHL